MPLPGALASRVTRSLSGYAAGILAVLGAALAVRWIVPPGPLADVALASSVVLFVALALARPRPEAFLAAVAFLVHAAVEAYGPWFPASYATRLRAEAVAAALPLLAFALLALLARRADVRAPGRPLAHAAVGLAALGSAARVGEALMLLGRPGDAHTIQFVLRYDAAYALWGLAASAVALAFATAPLASRGDPRRRGAEAGALAAAVIAFSLVALDVGAVVTAVALPRPGLLVGYHADRVADVPEGADLVHLEVAWPRVERVEGHLNWWRVDRELAAAVERNLSVFLLVTTYPPDWLVDKHADAIMVDAEGEPFTWLDEAPGRERRRVWDLSFANERVLDAKREFLADAVARYGAHPAVRYVAVQNEPAYPFDFNLLRWASFDPHTLAAFRESLRAEFDGDLAALNGATSSEFEAWEDVLPPRLPFGALGDRWVEFREDLLIRFVEDQLATARALTDRPVTVKVMAHFLTRFAEPQAGLSDRVYRAFANASEVVSVDLYPATEADLVRSLRYFKLIAHGKPLVVSEFHLGLGSGLPGSGARTLSALRVMEQEAEAVILFSASGHYLYSAGEGSLAVAGADAFARRPGAVERLIVAEAATLLALPSNFARALSMLRAASA